MGMTKCGINGPLLSEQEKKGKKKEEKKNVRL